MGAGKRGRTPGNGRVVVLKRAKDLTIHGKSYECGWTVVTVIELPPAIAFRDYSAITLYGADPSRLRVAIASQENSAVWIGHYNADTRQFLEDGRCTARHCTALHSTLLLVLVLRHGSEF